MRFLTLICVCMILGWSACTQSGAPSNPKPMSPYKPLAPACSGDSAMKWVKQQVAFGPRVPGTPAHKNCAAQIERELKRMGLVTQVQNGPTKTYDGKQFTLHNIIGSYAPEKQKRILLLAHWDTRPIADEDTERTNEPIEGADDGASGVAVMLEVARLVAQYKPDCGVDFFFSDLEDYGEPRNSTFPPMADSWCLGTQYFATHPFRQGYMPRFGILLDMVGAKGAMFPTEGTGLQYAGSVLSEVWQTAADLGYSEFFTNQQMGATTDDHLYINKLMGIPCIDIVHMNPGTGTYGTHHHTHRDNISIIDPNTMQMVGQVVLETIWKQ